MVPSVSAIYGDPQQSTPSVLGDLATAPQGCGFINFFYLCFAWLLFLLLHVLKNPSLTFLNLWFLVDFPVLGFFKNLFDIRVLFGGILLIEIDFCCFVSKGFEFFFYLVAASFFILLLLLFLLFETFQCEVFIWRGKDRFW